VVSNSRDAYSGGKKNIATPSPPSALPPASRGRREPPTFAPLVGATPSPVRLVNFMCVRLEVRRGRDRAFLGVPGSWSTATSMEGLLPSSLVVGAYGIPYVDIQHKVLSSNTDKQVPLQVILSVN
jgi:hypothetical protein